MSENLDSQPIEPQGTRGDPRERPADPAGTRPKFDPETLKPSRPGPLAELTSGGPPPVQEQTQALPQPIEPSLVPEPSGVSPALAVSAPARVTSAYAPRFQFLFGALAALGVAALAIAAAILGAPKAKPGPPWSDWKPLENSIDPAQQIANHVAPQYKLSNGHELLQVTGGPQSVNGQPVVLALRKSGSEPTALPDNGVFYQLCGGGVNCSIAEGKASVERGLLVRREALELALYTFRYISGASQVLVTFPPPPPTHTSKHGSSASKSSSSLSSSSVSSSSSSTSSSLQTPNHVLLFRSSELAGLLSRPLDESLPGKTPTVSTMDASANAAFVNTLTEKALYDSVLIPQQQSGPVLLLEPPSLGG